MLVIDPKNVIFDYSKNYNFYKIKALIDYSQIRYIMEKVHLPVSINGVVIEMDIANISFNEGVLLISRKSFKEI